MTINSTATALTKNQIAETVPMIRPSTEYSSFDEYKYGGKVLPIRKLAEPSIASMSFDRYL